MHNRIILTATIALVVGLAGSYLLYGTSRKTITSTTPTSTTLSVGGVTFTTDATNTAGITIEPVSLAQVPRPIPTLSTQVSFLPAANVSPDAQKIIISKVATLVAKLTADPGDFNSWLALGQYRKFAGEYTQARDAWEYAKKLAPSDIQAYNNLGDLYQFYLKDESKAEANWKETVVLNPKYVIGYRALYDFYTQAGDSTKALGALTPGLAKNPNSVDLLVLIGQYYRDHAGKNQALAYYTKALAVAKLVHEDASLVPAIQAELDALK